MKKQDSVDFLALEAELRTHEKIMKQLSEIYGHDDSYIEINGYRHYWHAHVLPSDQICAIARRQNHEELVYMIHQYGKCAPPASWYTSGLWKQCYGNDHILPDEVQEIIAKRCNDEELDAYITYNGFGLAGQRQFWASSSHDQRMRYLVRHGFLPEIQDQMRAGGNQEEINLHIQKHGMHFGWETEIIQSGDEQKFKHCVDLHEFSVAGQKLMCQSVSSPLFYYYIEKWGLWEQVHCDLIHYRDNSELRRYIEIHPYLSDEAETELCAGQDRKLIRYYIILKHKNKGAICQALRSTFNTDYPFLLDCLRLEGRMDELEKAEVEFMSQGDETEIAAYIQNNRPSLQAVYTMLARKMDAPTQIYLQKWASTEQ